MPNLLFKRFRPEAVAPFRKHSLDAGFDLTAVSRKLPKRPGIVTYETHIGVEIPPGHVGILKERSSLRDRGLSLVGGVIDAGYTGPIEVSFRHDGYSFPYAPGDRVCQLLVVPLAALAGVEEVSELPDSGRGSKGFGSTGT